VRSELGIFGNFEPKSKIISTTNKEFNENQRTIIHYISTAGVMPWEFVPGMTQQAKAVLGATTWLNCRHQPSAIS
jgi:hypothetical protein